MFCSNCGHEINKNHSFCVKCGAPVSAGHIKKNSAKPNKNKRYINLIIIILFICIFIIGALLFSINYFSFFPENKSNRELVEELDNDDNKTKNINKNKDEKTDFENENNIPTIKEDSEEINIKECTELLNLVSGMLDVFYYNQDKSTDGDLAAVAIMNSVCSGNTDSILKFLGFNDGNNDTNARLPSLLFQNNMLCDMHVADICLAKEQLNEVAYSLSGIDNLFDNYEEEHIPLGTCIGFGGGCYLQNPVTEYIGNNCWNVKADVYYSNDFDELDYFYIAKISFQIVRDEKSYYDGYRVTAIQSLESQNWSECFRNYLTINDYYVVECDNIFDYEPRYDIKQYYMFHLDNDGIPEIFVEGISYADGYHILHYYKDNVYEQNLSSGFASFIPETGILLSNYGKMEYYGDTILKLENGILQTVAIGNYSFNIDEEAEPILDRDGNVIFLDGSNWNETMVTNSKQYEELYDLTLLELKVEKNNRKNCLDEEFYIGDIDSLLHALP